MFKKKQDDNDGIPFKSQKVLGAMGKSKKIPRGRTDDSKYDSDDQLAKAKAYRLRGK